ncbi:MAG TPA: non-homologous end-joining DNA ligase, partial [Candidatus Acidoferrum sp.]|nr:non-homologous end-joining DNA ligase [Candidatus Acidoferrum sp.]
EGVIPSKQYGAGDVIVWDWGTWEQEQAEPKAGKPAKILQPREALDGGELKFRLDGEKLHGRFTIIKTKPRDGDSGEPWLMIHKKDDAASPGWDAEDHPKSVKSGRTNDEVKANRDAIWVSKAPAAQAEIDLSAAVESPLPGFIEPMLATLAGHPFDSPDWLFEIKWDGYRVQAIVKDDSVKTFTRSGKDAATYFPGLLSPVNWIWADTAIVDGEVVALDPKGAPSFELLQQRISGDAAVADVPLVYMVFDLLYLDGQSLLKVPLEDRKRLLRSVIREHPRVKFATHIEADGRAFFAAAEKSEIEGIVAKRRRSTYEPGRRTGSWLKLKVRPEQELVVGGYVPGEGSHKDIGALLVGVYEGSKLRYSGRVGSGLRGPTRAALKKRLDTLARPTPPFDPAPPRTGELREAVFAKPEIVIRAEFAAWTRDGTVRQSAFKGILEGRDPRSVVRERPVASPSEAQSGASHGPSFDASEASEASESPDHAPGGMPGRRSSAAKIRSVARDSQVSGFSKQAPAPRSEQEPAPVSDDERPRDAHPTHATDEELEALKRIEKEGVWKVGGRELKLTNLDKTLFPPHPDTKGDKPITKRELIAYFAQIGPQMLPHLAERPLNLNRFPNGVGGPSFWQKDVPDTAPQWLRRWKEDWGEGMHGDHRVGPEHRTANTHLVADEVATLCWLGNQASFEVHAWTSRLDAPMRPTYALIDIDPGDKTTWAETVTLARLYRTALGHLKVVGFPKVTGKRGIQVWIPVETRYSFADTSAWVEGVSRAVGAMVPDLVSWEWSVADRKGRARLDYTQNASIKTLVAPYAVRPLAGAPVSAPITWDELDDPDLRPDRWTVRTILPRVAEQGDLFAGALSNPQVLPALG